MTRYHYVTIDLRAFATLAKLPVPADSYISEDQDSKVIREIMNKGYRFVTFIPGAELALFEKAITATQVDAIAVEKMTSKMSEDAQERRQLHP